MKTGIAVTATGDDAILKDAIEAASGMIDNMTSKQFRVYTETLEFKAEAGGHLDIPALLSITTLKTDDDGDRTYENTWASTDYDLLPYNAAQFGEPYTRLETTPDGNYSFPTVSKGVELDAKWGYRETLERATSLVDDADVTASDTTLTVDAGTDFEVGETILIDSEQMYITTIASELLTVNRGVNGTTAATHANDANIDIYRYPPEIREATRVLASELFAGRNAPLGIIGTNDLGLQELQRRGHPHVWRALAGFVPQGGMVAV